MTTPDKITQTVDRLPLFIQEAAQAYIPVLQRMPEEQLFALVDLIADGSMQDAAAMLVQNSTLIDLAAAKEHLNRTTQRMADERALVNQVAGDVLRATLRAAIHAMLAA